MAFFLGRPEAFRPAARGLRYLETRAECLDRT
jgi:hypothetical protein